MKQLSLILCFVAMTVVSALAQATPTETVQEEVVQADGFKTAALTVAGNCGMCKSRIEGALKDVLGVESATWDVDSKILTVSFNAKVISLDDIQKKVAAVGHDTDKFKADDAVYEGLPGCCKYERLKS